MGSWATLTTTLSRRSRFGLYKAEPIRPDSPWRGVEDVELGTLNWVDQVNTERTHKALDDLTPMATETLHYTARNKPQPAG